MTSRCEQHPGMCCGDPMCPDKHCPAHPGVLVQIDGGASVDTDDIDHMLTVAFAVLGAFAWFVYYSAPIILAALPFH